MNSRPQKYESRDPFPQFPFHCEEIDGMPTLNEALVVFLIVSFLTVVFSF